MVLGKAAYNQQKNKATNCIKNTVGEGNVLNFKENWRNLISTSEVIDEDNYNNKRKLITDELTDNFIVNDKVFETSNVAPPVLKKFSVTSTTLASISEGIPPTQSIENITEKNVSKITASQKAQMSYNIYFLIFLRLVLFGIQ